MTTYLIGAVICLALSAFFSGSEMAFSSANRIRLENQAEDGSKLAALAVRIIDQFDDALSAILIGNNFVNIAISSLGSVIAITAFGEEDTWIATVIVTVSVIIFGETMPKIVAKKNANRLALAFAGPVRFLTIVFKPLTLLVVGLVRLVTLPLKGEKDSDQDDAVEELQSIIETAEDEDVLDEDRSELLQNALDFNEISASEVMTARVDIMAVDIKDSPQEIYEAACESGFSRIPVYEGSIDNIIGVLYLNHYFKALLDDPDADLRKLLMEPCYVYKTTKLPAVLETLKRAKQHLAIVTDEYGGCWSRSWATSGTRPTRSRTRWWSAPAVNMSWTATWPSTISRSWWAWTTRPSRPRAPPWAAGRWRCSAPTPRRDRASSMRTSPSPS